MCQVSERRSNLRRAWAAGTLIMLASVAAPINLDAHAAAPPIVPQAPRNAPESTTRPHPLDNDVAELIVRVRGVGLCSGTPITNTRYVVTAAHCVLDHDGDLGPRSVVRGGITYRAVAALVDTGYHDDPSARLDAAVLIMDQPIPGASARLGSVLPTQGTVTLAGYQPVDSDGTLLRGHGPHDLLLPKGATGTLIEIHSVPAGCDQPAAALETTPPRVTVHCGLIPGSSGGPLLARTSNELVLVGVISTVSSDLSTNGIVPLASLHHLLTHPETYYHDLANNHRVAEPRSVRSGGTLS